MPADSRVSITASHLKFESCLIIALGGCGSSSDETVSGYAVLVGLE